MTSLSEASAIFDDSELKVGDAVVHFEHGVARYDGIETVEFENAKQTLVKFVYREDGKLMLPAIQGKDFWQYGAPATGVTLDRLKAGDWERRRDKIIDEIKASVKEIKQKYEQREKTRAHQLKIPTAKFNAFSDTFKHDETEEQLDAINHVIADLGAKRPMNRLIIGDVGFGKTEVAIRASAIASLCGYQVAIAAPTTVLVTQHFETWTARFADFGIGVAQLTRLTSAKEIAEIEKGVNSGKIKIVIGTQSLLSADFKLKNLGLIVIDEEHKFGLDEKEQFLALSDSAHVLSMTATPIPRTLAAAEIGLVDISIVSTPPLNRKPVETSLRFLSIDHLINAIDCEHKRKGQSYVICASISELQKLYRKISKKRPGITIAQAHRQLDDDELESCMSRFQKGEVDVLLSTTIIENGLDIPNANTMVVWQAEQFGLSQLHQLRGRIGRSNVQAYMFLLTETDRFGGDTCVERIQVFAETSKLGAGFEISKLDRYFRGFGELNGESQSGKLSHVGLGFYRHIIRQVLQH